jgi:sorting nexin-1/2
MHNATDTMYAWRKDLAASTKDFAKNTAILANSEEQLGLSRALSQLSEIYEKIDAIYLEQSNSDYFVLSELVKDYVSLFENIREVFYQRIKTYNNWQKNEELLRAKREAKTKLEAANKLDKIPTVAAEIRDVKFLNHSVINYGLFLREIPQFQNFYVRLQQKKSCESF